MRRTLSFEDYVDGLSTATARLVAEAEGAGLDAPVPTCPEWTTAQLVAHQGMVHRWATAALRGQRLPDTEAIEQQGLSAVDPLGWLQDGAERLAAVLEHTPQDADIWFFLSDELSPRDGWARRQCHETTIHAVDALAARQGTLPDISEVDIDAALAADGVDELLCAFTPRAKTDLRLEREATVAVISADTGDDWTLRLGPGQPAAERGLPAGDIDARWSAPAVDLYLGLWNRGGRIAQEGRHVLDIWHDQMRVRW